jgi:hypothetical protein
MECLPNGKWVDLRGDSPRVDELGESLLIKWQGMHGSDITVVCEPSAWSIAVSPRKSWALEIRWAPTKTVPIEQVESDRLQFRYEQFPYEVTCLSGYFQAQDDGCSILVRPGADGTVRLGLDA